MDKRHLEVFVAVARAGTFTRAATELHLVQSAVSATVAALESDLDERLFDRTTRRVRLTAAGQALLPKATAILDAFQDARETVDAVTAGLSGSLRIGYMTNVTLFDVPCLLGRFYADHPGVTMHLSPAATGTAGLAEGLRGGDLDLAFLSAEPEDHPDLSVTVLARSPMGLVVPAGHPLAGRARVRFADIVLERFVEYRTGFATRTLVDGEFRRRGLWRDIQIETSDVNDAAALVRNGLGVGILPRYSVERVIGLHWIPIEDATLETVVSVATYRGRTPSAAASRLAALATATR
ncbi:LysR family transcriptional regulator [Actinoplanes sp. M2I2]|uniref:LysR family transcriptional regulator n=1 Tax=Actinoplanes sp. M2I2 TaxID=1734444 RepID=UPI002021DA00|nr:LysR family transcriptional regulator [Actinoplanes sp. M2I2]